jgi:hypothetical protein
MAFKEFAAQEQGVELLQRSLERGRLAHGYLFTGHVLDQLEGLARTLAKTLNCLHPVKRGGVAVDCCDQCLGCQKVEHGNHADVFWVRPESKLRQIRIRQIVRRDDSPSRVLLDTVNLKPTESRYKVAIIVAADRMNEEAANALLKTLEEPPPHSVLVLLTTAPLRLLEPIRSRCLRLNFAGEGPQLLSPAQTEWLATFSDLAAADQKSLLGRYRLMDVLLKRLNAAREAIDENLTARSPLEKYNDAEEAVKDKWEQELKAAIEAEYRRQRADYLLGLQWWFRDVWVLTHSKVQSPKPKAQSRDGAAPGSETLNPQLSTINSPESLLVLPDLAGTRRVAERITPKQAAENLRVMEQLQRWLSTNVQEALALEVGLLKLHL